MFSLRQCPRQRTGDSLQKREDSPGAALGAERGAVRVRLAAVVARTLVGRDARAGAGVQHVAVGAHAARLAHLVQRLGRLRSRAVTTLDAQTQTRTRHRLLAFVCSGRC